MHAMQEPPVRSSARS